MRTSDFTTFFAVLVMASASACGQPVDSESAPVESFGVSASDGKSDSLLTHELELSVDETSEWAPTAWGPDMYETFAPSVTVTDFSDEHVSVTTEEFIFRPPADMDRQLGDGWMVYLNRNATVSHNLDLGTAFSIMVFHRPVNSDDDWTLIEMPHPDADGELTPYLASFRSGEGEEPESAAVSSIPDGRCALVHGHSDGSEYLLPNAELHIPELDADGETEFRIVVVPSFNFCEWETDTYVPEVIVTPANSIIDNTA